jgi:GTPase SAR1 family protein
MSANTGGTVPFPNDEEDEDERRINNVVDAIGQVLHLMTRAADLELEWSRNPAGPKGSIRAVKQDLNAVRNGELRMAVVAPMKAGKSTLVNSIVGYEFLPARGAAMTTLPTRIVLDHLATDEELSAPDGLRPTLHLDEADVKQFGRLVTALRTPLKSAAPKILGIRPFLQGAVDLVLSGQPVDFSGPVEGQTSVQGVLKLLNDLVRLAGLLGMSKDALYLSDVPVVRTPYWSPAGVADGGPGCLVIIDTPGPDEEGLAPVLESVVKGQLAESHVVFVVLDYTRMGTHADATVRELMQPTLDAIGIDKLYAIVNKIDQRNEATDLDDAGIVRSVAAILGMPEETAERRVFKTSAEWALRSVIVLAESLGGRLGDPASSKSAQRLAELAYPLGWQDELEDMSQPRLEKLARRGWEKKGRLDEFLGTALADLRKRALPNAIESALAKTGSEAADLVAAVTARRDLIGREAADLANGAARIARDMTEVAKFREKVASPGKIADQTVGAIKKILDRADHRGEEVIQQLETDLKSKGEKSRSFASESDARLFIQAKTGGPSAAIDGFLASAREQAELEIGQSAAKYVAAEGKKIRGIVEKAAAELKTDFSIAFTVPDFVLTVSASEGPAGPERQSNTHYRTETRTRTERRWYTLWLKEYVVTENVEVPYSSTSYVVKFDTLAKSLRKSLQKRLDAIGAELSSHVRQALEERVQQYYDAVDAFLARYRNILAQSAKDNGLADHEKRDLLRRLTEFHTAATAAKNAIEEQLHAN